MAWFSCLDNWLLAVKTAASFLPERAFSMNSTLLFKQPRHKKRESFWVWKISSWFKIGFCSSFFRCSPCTFKLSICAFMKLSMHCWTFCEFSSSLPSCISIVSTVDSKAEMAALASCTSFKVFSFSTTNKSFINEYLWPWWSIMVQSRHIGSSQVWQNSFSVSPSCFAQIASVLRGSLSSCSDKRLFIRKFEGRMLMSPPGTWRETLIYIRLQVAYEKTMKRNCKELFPLNCKKQRETFRNCSL